MKTLNKWLLQSAEEEDYKWFVSLIKFWGVNINFTNEAKETPLHIAIKNKNIPMIKCLLNYSNIIDINAYDINNNTPLHIIAADRNDTEIFPLIINHPTIEIEAPNKRNEMPLHIAAQSGNAKLVKSLIEKGVNINLCDDERNTSLLIALIHDKGEVAKLLLTQPDIYVDWRGNNLDTALHIALRRGDPEMVDLLLAKKADLNLANKDGDTPLHIAVKEDYLEVIKRLIKAEANLNVSNEDGNTPLAIALQTKKLAVAKFLLAQPRITISPEDQNNYNQLQKEAIKPVLEEKINEKVCQPGGAKYPKMVKFKSVIKFPEIKQPALPKKLYPELRDSINESLNEAALNQAPYQDDFDIKLLGSSDSFSAPL